MRSPVILALLAIATTSQAWNATGHMVIAAIADRYLKPDVRIEVARLAKIGATDQNSDPFGAAVWADDIRSSRPESGPWHYIDFYFRTDGKPVNSRLDENNVVTAIKRFTAILQDKSKPDAERAEALRFVMHFVGDVHQPLHGSSFESNKHPTGDKGGNSYALIPPKQFSDMQRPPNQLHSLWDLGVGLFPQIRRPLTAETTLLVQRQADTLIAATPPSDVPERLQTDPMTWAKESFETAKSVAYSVPEGTEPTEAYIALGQKTCAKRAVLAGYRLADLLNRVLGS